jgi:hypothetical protein
MLYRAALAFALLLPGATIPAAIVPALAETQEERMACTPDAQLLCADEIPDRDKVYSCLVRKVNDLSPACKRIIAASIAPASKGGKK